MNALPQLLRTGTITIGWIAVLPCLIVMMSAMVPVVPWLRLYAVNVVPEDTSRLWLASAAVMGAAAVAHRRRSSRATTALMVCAASAVAAATFIIISFEFISMRNGVWLDPVTRPANLDTLEPTETRTYVTRAGEPLMLDVYRPTVTAPGGRSPVMITIHGGGFSQGGRTSGPGGIRRHTGQGWTIVSIDYRLARPDRPTWNLAADDVRCALVWVAAHADEFNMDAGRIVISGISAGGTLAVAAGYDLQRRSDDEACPGAVPPVAAIIARSPLLDARASWYRPGEMQHVQQSYMRTFLGGSPTDQPLRYASLDLRRHLRPGQPPTLIFAGTDDPLIPIASTRAFAEMATSRGGAVDLVDIPFSGHDIYGERSLPAQAAMRIEDRFLSDLDLMPKKVVR